MLTSTAWSAGADAARTSQAKAGVLQSTLQRSIDVLASGILLLLASPLLLLTALAVWLTDFGGVFYRQIRVGLNGRPFEMLKFRSMRVNDLPIDDVTEIEVTHPLVTPVGRWIRRLKVNELPNLLNVLRGDMSLIGPRPPMPEHVEKYDTFQRRRLQVRPGITGWAQVNGGIELTWPQRIMLDIWYIDHRTFWLDVKIMWRTAAVILIGERRNPPALQEAMAYAEQQAELNGPMAPRLYPATTRGRDQCDVNDSIPSVATIFAPGSNGGVQRPDPCRVVLLTSAREALDVRIFHKECKSLAMAGYDVTVIGLGSETDTTQQGIKIRAIPRPQSRSERMTRTIWKVYTAALRAQGDIYHFHDPELMPVGALLRMRGKRVVYDVREEFAFDIRYKQWIPELLRRPLSLAYRASEMAFTRVFDRVIAATPAIARNYPADKTRCVRNFPWSQQFRRAEGLPYEEREPIAIYVGVLADNRGLREMTEAVELAAKTVPIKLVLAGPVNSGTNAEFLPKGDNGLFECKGNLDFSLIPRLLARARIGLIVMHPMVNKLESLPVKLFEYMAAGLPVVVSDLPLWRHIVQSSQCGLVVDPLNPAAVAEALVWLLRHPAEAVEMGRNGQRAVAEQYNWEHEAECLIATYAKLQDD